MPGAAPDHNVRPILTAQARCVNPNHGLHTHFPGDAIAVRLDEAGTVDATATPTRSVCA